MTAHQPSTERDVAKAPLVRRVRIAALMGTGVWVFTVLAVLSGWFDPTFDARWKQPVQTALILATPLFIVLVFPALVLSFLGGPRGARIAVWLLLVAVITFVAMLAGPIVMALVR